MNESAFDVGNELEINQRMLPASPQLVLVHSVNYKTDVTHPL